MAVILHNLVKSLDYGTPQCREMPSGINEENSSSSCLWINEYKLLVILWIKKPHSRSNHCYTRIFYPIGRETPSIVEFAPPTTPEASGTKAFKILWAVSQLACAP